MKKVIVFRVENVLVKGYDEKRMDEVSGKKLLKGLVGEEFIEKELMKEDGGKKVMMSGVEMVEKMKELEKRFEEDGEIEKRFWMRDVRRKMEEREEGKERRLEEMRRKNLEEGFEKRRIEKKEELKDLERICERVGGRMVFVSGIRKGRIERLLRNNGLRKFEVEMDMEFLKEEDMNGVAVFDTAGKLKDFWSEIGLRKS